MEPTKVAGAVVEVTPVLADNLGMYGLIVVLSVLAMVGGLVFIFVKFMSHAKDTQDRLIRANKENQEILVKANREIHDNAREDAKLNREAMQNFTTAIHLSNNIRGNNRS